MLIDLTEVMKGFLATAVLAIVVLCVRFICKAMRRRAFKRVFGLVPEKSGIGRMIQQPIVDSNLSSLARHFNDFVVRENAFLKQYRDQEKAQAYLCRTETDLALWKELRASLTESKKRFWGAHKLARQLGFGVRAKYKEYLGL